VTVTELSSNQAQPFAALADRYNPKSNYVSRPIAWVRDRTKGFLWSAQRQIARSVAKNRYTAAYSAHDLGKSFIAANIITWWIDSHPPGEAFVVSTAPTAAQVSAIMWREVGKLHSKHKLPGRINRAGYPTWYIGSQLIGYGRKPADYEQSAFQGIHERYVLVVIDEACGVMSDLFDQVDALVTNEDCRVLAIGNPDHPGSHFAEVCKPGSIWNVIHLDGLRSPNMTKDAIIGDDPANPKYPLLAALMRHEGIPFSEERVPLRLRPLLISPLWVEERIRSWCGIPDTAALDHAPDELGEIVARRAQASPIFTAKVRGNFPLESSDGVIPLGWVQRAVERWHDAMDGQGDLTTWQRADGTGRKVVGVDVAYGGEDETIVAVRYANIIEPLHAYRVADTMEIADNVAPFLQEPKSLAVVDGIGVGAGVYDALRRYARDGTIQGRAHAFIAGAQSHRRDLTGQFRFRNDRSAAWWHMRELLDPSRGSNICLPDDERLIHELSCLQYEIHANAIIQVEGKDKARKRLGRSTDRADAVIQAFWVEAIQQTIDPLEWGDMSGEGAQPVRYGGYDPFGDNDLAAAPGFGGTGSDFRGAGGLRGDLLGDPRG